MSVAARPGASRRGWAALLCVLLAVACVGCAGPRAGAEPEPRDPGRVRIASFDFPESRVVAELYARALREAGIAVDVLSGLGTREVVAPALQQGQVDLVVDYAGSLLDYLGGSAAETHGAPEQVRATLLTRLAGRGLAALAYAPAEDVNAFAVRADFARQHQLSRLSDLRALAGRLTFGGPPECPTRRYCLQGLQKTYGLRFAEFRSQPSRGATATALESGEIDVGLLETTSGQLGDGRVTLLLDDRGLQPRENLLPVVRAELVRRYGTRLTAPLDAVSARLTTADLVRLNHIAAVNPVEPAEAVAAYLRLTGR
jgi:osmoprotectant transport system substrate-binding protein